MFLGIAAQLVKIKPIPVISAGITYLILFTIVSFLIITWKRIMYINLTKAENNGLS